MQSQPRRQAACYAGAAGKGETVADYKVVFRADGGGGGKPASWEPGCPLLVKAIQVARNTQTGEAYLQLKLWNLTDEVVESFTLMAEVTYRDGTQETLEVSPLDADIARGCSYRPEPAALAQGAVAAASARIVAATYGNTTWHSEQPVITTPQQPLDLSEDALAERRILIADLGKPADEYSTRAFAGDGWWVCPCGTPNVGRERCVACSMSIGTLHKLEDEDYLNSRMRERLEAEKRERRRKKVTRVALVTILLCCTALAAGYFFVFVPSSAYDKAMEMAAGGTEDRQQYANAYYEFQRLGNYRDSEQQAVEAALGYVEEWVMSGQAEEATSWIGHRLDNPNPDWNLINSSAEAKAQKYIDEGRYASAAAWFDFIGDDERSNEAKYQYVTSNIDGDFSDFVLFYLRDLAEAGYEDAESLLESYSAAWSDQIEAAE